MTSVGGLTGAEGGSLLVAALALVLGCWNAYRDCSLRRSISEKERRANLTIRLEGRAKGGRDQLMIANAGPAAAHHVHVLIGGASLLHHEWFLGDQEMSGPLGPTSEYPYDVRWEADRPTEVTVTWTDDSGVRGEYRTTIQPRVRGSAAFIS